MTRRILLVLLPVLGLAVGVLIGLGNAPTEEEASQLRVSSEKAAFQTSFSEAFAASRIEGRRAGQKKGSVQGKRAGLKAGSDAGAVAAEAELAAIAAEEAEEAESALICDHPTLSGCLTQEQIAYGEAAETLCGGGRYEEAAAQGIRC